MKRLLLLVYNEGERGKFRMHFPDGGTVVIQGNAYSNVGQEFDAIYYTKRVRDEHEDWMFDMLSMATPQAEISLVQL